MTPVSTRCLKLWSFKSLNLGYNHSFLLSPSTGYNNDYNNNNFNKNTIFFYLFFLIFLSLSLEL